MKPSEMTELPPTYRDKVTLLWTGGIVLMCVLGGVLAGCFALLEGAVTGVIAFIIGLAVVSLVDLARWLRSSKYAGYFRHVERVFDLVPSLSILVVGVCLVALTIATDLVTPPGGRHYFSILACIGCLIIFVGWEMFKRRLRV